MSGTICPKDMSPCLDDMCRGSGVCAITRTELLERCPRCGQPFEAQDECYSCEPNDDLYYVGEEDWPEAQS